MSTMIEMVIVYTLVASVLLYVMRGRLMKLLFKKSAPSEEGCGACESGGCASCKIHNMPDPTTL